MDILSMQNVSLSFGSTRALDGLSFAVKEGEIFGFLGPSGAGKTTTIKLLTRQLRPGAKIPPKAHKADTGIRIETISCTIPAAYAARAGTAFIFSRHTRLLCQNRYCRRMASMRPLLSGTPDSGPFSSRSA